jgi:glycosyltransferase involved in cell wall biosynthesis
LRVLHVTPYFAPAFRFGGPPRSILALCHAQRAAGLDVEVLTTTANGNGSLPSATSGTTFEGVPVRYFPLAGPALFFWSPQLARELWRLSDRADVIHTHGLFNAPAWQAHRVSQQSTRPLVVSVRGMLEPEARAHHAWRKRAAWSLFDRRVCADAALLHTTSARETASVRATVPDVAIAEIPNAVGATAAAVTADERDGVRRRIGIARDVPFVMFVGRIHPIKRLDLLARAFALVAADHPDVRLVIAGAGDMRVRHQAEAELGGARARALWLGEVSDRERDALLSEAATLVLCSDSENFGMSVAEALACGVAPVVTRTCPWEILERERAGYWVPQTADAIAGAIRHLLASPDARREMGERGRRLVAAQFSSAAIGARWAEEYGRLGR